MLMFLYKQKYQLFTVLHAAQVEWSRIHTIRWAEYTVYMR
jgi:hypothetical protein